jgi:hypothetical protein
MTKSTSTFKLIFGTVVGFTFISGITAVGIASQPRLTLQQEQVFETCQTTWEVGTKGVLGLMVGNFLQENKDKKNQSRDKNNN